MALGDGVGEGSAEGVYIGGGSFGSSSRLVSGTLSVGWPEYESTRTAPGG